MKVPLVRVLAALFLAVVVVAAVIPDVLSPADPAAPEATAYALPSAAHPLGTDDIGRDVASRLIHGARSSVTTAVGCAAVALGLGGLVGIVAPLLGPRSDAVAQRVTDVVIAIPRLPLLIVVAALGATSRGAMIVTLGMLAWAPMARVLRGEVLVLRHSGYVLAARGLGARTGYVVRRHLLPTVAPLLIAEGAMVSGSAVLMVASLSFLGLHDGAASWGAEMQRSLAEPAALFSPAWLWWAVPNGLAITGSVLVLLLLASKEST